MAQPIDVPKETRRTIKKFNLITTQELEEAIERSGAPGGITYSEFFQILKEPKVVAEIKSSIYKKSRKELSTEEVIDLINGIDNSAEQ